MVGARDALSILVIAPLPFRRNGARVFEFGGSNFSVALFPRLARLGHRVRVLAEAPPVEGEETATGLEWDVPNLQVEWFAVAYRSAATPPSPAYLEHERRRLEAVCDRLLSEEPPDAVVLSREMLAWHGLDLCQRRGVRSLLIAHGSPTAALSQGIYPAEVRTDLVERLRQVDWIVAVAHHLEATLRGWGLTRLSTIRNVCDPTRFCPAPKDAQLLMALRIPREHIVVGHPSSLRQGKRPLDVVASAARVLRVQPRVTYLLMGDGPCRPQMEEQIRQMGLSENFRCVGPIAHAEMPAYLNVCDIVVSASEREGFPLTYRETQACGRVLVTSDILAAREAIVDGATGILFRLGDIADLTAKILAAVADASWRQRIGAQARAVVAAESPDGWARAYADVLRGVASGATEP
jgi:glycosyltransferase involved in cell wall biosynthesis